MDLGKEQELEVIESGAIHYKKADLLNFLVNFSFTFFFKINSSNIVYTSWGNNYFDYIYKVMKRVFLLLLFIFSYSLISYAQNAASFYQIGVNMNTEQKYKEAITEFSKAIEIDPYFGDAYFQRGLSKGKIKDFYGAISDFTKALKISPEKDILYHMRGVTKVSLEDYREAIKDFDKAIKLDPKNSEYYFIRGLSKVFLGKKESGCLDLSRSGELGNNNAYNSIKDYCN